MFAAGVAARAGLNGDDDDAVDDRLSFLGRPESPLIVDLADGIATIGNDHHHLSTLAAIERLGSHVHGIVERSGRAETHAVNAVINAVGIGGEGHDLIHVLAETVEGEAIDRAQDGMDEAPRRG